MRRVAPACTLSVSRVEASTKGNEIVAFCAAPRRAGGPPPAGGVPTSDMGYGQVRRRSVANLNKRKGRKSIEKWAGDDGKGTAGDRQQLFLLSKMHEDLGKKLERALKAENNWKPLHHSRPMVDVARMVVNWTEGMQC